MLPRKSLTISERRAKKSDSSKSVSTDRGSPKLLSKRFPKHAKSSRFSTAQRNRVLSVNRSSSMSQQHSMKQDSTKSFSAADATVSVQKTHRRQASSLSTRNLEKQNRRRVSPSESPMM